MLKQKFNSGLLILLVLVMSFSMEVSIVQAAEEISSGVHTILFGNDRYSAKGGSLTKNGDELDLELENGELIKYGIMNGVLCALVDENGEEQWMEVDEHQNAVQTTHGIADSSGNESVIYSFLTNDMGLNTAAACGILANINNESGFNPQSSCIDTNGLVSYGICQWNGGRFMALQRYCAANGYDYRTLAGQLLYLKYELHNGESAAFSKVSSVANTQEGAFIAGYNWATFFERCASKYYASRAILARDVYWPKYVAGSHPVGNVSSADLSMLAAGSGPMMNPNPGTGQQPAPVPQTAAAPAAPTVTSAGVTGLTENDAVVNYQMNNPSAAVITYLGVFVYDAAGTEIAAFGTNPLIKDTAKEGGFKLSSNMGALKPETKYQYRFIVKTESARVVSDLYSFTTPAAAGNSEPSGGDETQNTDQNQNEQNTDGGNGQPAPTPVIVRIDGAQLAGGQLSVRYTSSVDTKMEIVLKDASGSVFSTKYIPVQANTSQMDVLLNDVELPESYSAVIRLLDAGGSKAMCDTVSVAGQ